MTGRTKIEKFVSDCCNFWEVPYEFIDTDGCGIVDIAIVGGKEYNRDRDLKQYPNIFANADKELREVSAKYQPHIVQFGNSL